MAPICSRAAFRVLTSVLVASSIANAAALPHQVLDPRTPLAQPEALPEAQAEAPATSGGDDDDPDNVFEEFGEILNTHSGYEFLRDLIERLFGLRSEEDGDGNDDPDETVTTTVFVTPTPVEVSSSVIEIVVTPIGPPSSTMPEGGSESTPTPSPSDGISILPVGPMTTAINVTLPDPVISSILVDSSEISIVIPPFPVNVTVVGPTPTAVSITDEFSATLLPGTGQQSSSSVNASAPESTTSIQLTSVVIVTATVVPLPISVGTGIYVPVSEAATPLWPNATLVIPTPASSGTGVVSAETGISNATVTESPLYPNITLVVPTLITVTGSPGTALNVSLPLTVPPYANISDVFPTAYTGTGSAVAAANTTFSEIPLYPNTTVMVGTGTGAPIAATGVATPITFSESPLYANTTILVPVVILGTGTAAVSAGTISNAPIAETAAPLFPNVTTTTSTTTTTIGASTLPTLVISVNETQSSNDTALEFPGLITFRRLCQDPQIRVITLPLLDRFYGPNAYPSLFSFPGCIAPNDRQAVQAPGLLDCTALGVEVQRCQASGRKVLLSVKADGLDAVGGNADFGDPAGAPEPFGPYFAAGDGDEFDEFDGEEKRKRQIQMNVTVVIPPFPVLNATAPEPLGSVSVLSASAPAPTPMSTATSVPEEPAVLPYPTPMDPTEPPAPFPNLFDEGHPPSAFALTLFSLFGEGHTERADLRPLGPEVGSPSSPTELSGTDWVNPPSSIIPMLDRPLGEEVVVDGFDVQVPSQWKATYQDTSFKSLVASLRDLNRAAWRESGGVEGGPGDLGADGRGVVYFGWVGDFLKTREAKLMRQGWVEWDGQTWG